MTKAEPSTLVPYDQHAAEQRNAPDEAGDFGVRWTIGVAPVRYDPMVSPDPVAWLGLDESGRIEVALRYHERVEAEAGSLRAHSAIHAAVETQLAEGRATTLEALRRLLQEGLDRHKAIHAIGSLVAGELYAAMTGKRSDESSYDERLAALNAAKWRDSVEE